ncbi:MAG: cbb3-type cytochrome oxidase assembly protein CcoS [Pseudomonadota bacterium]
MEALYLLIPLSVLIVAVALVAFFAMSDGGQFDDMKGPALRLLQDDDRASVEGEAGDRGPNAPPPSLR